jgi:hypothetical protein
MFRFHADRFNKAMELISFLRRESVRYHELVQRDRHDQEGWKTLANAMLCDHIHEELSHLLSVLRKMGMMASYKAVERLKESIKPERRYWELETWVNDIFSRVNDELSERYIFAIAPQHSVYYHNHLLGWQSVLARCPDCTFDVEEAGKAIAFERHTAAVFHLMRVTEFGVLELQTFLEKRDFKAHFGSVVARVETLVQKTKFDDMPPHIKPHIDFLKAILPQLHAVKDSWRNRVSHADGKIIPADTFTEEMAGGVYLATRLLMGKLTEGLP